MSIWRRAGDARKSPCDGRGRAGVALSSPARYGKWLDGWKSANGFRCPATIEREWMEVVDRGDVPDWFRLGEECAAAWRRDRNIETISEVKW